MSPRPRAIKAYRVARDLRLFDECYCGDYRGDHRGKWHQGGCTLPDDMTHGYETCRYFTLHKAANALPHHADRSCVFARFKRIAARG